MRGLKLVFFCLLWAVIISSAGASFGQSVPSDPASIEAAKRDGEAVWYTMESVHIVEALRKKFEETFPFVKIRMFRIRSADIWNRIAAESTTGRYVFDVATTNASTAYAMKKRGFTKAYFPSEGKLLAPAFRDSEGHWYAPTFEGYGIGYNTRLVKTPPKTYDELLAPTWRGKIALDTQDYDWLGFQFKLRGEKEGLAFMRELSKNVVMRKGHSLGVQMVAAGEFSAFINGLGSEFFRLKNEGAPVDLVFTTPLYLGPRATSLSAKSPHEGAARLFLEWLFSKEAARFITQIGRSSTRGDVERFPAALSKISNFFAHDAAYYESRTHYAKLFNEVFMR
ncbi:MAG: extracellular solute-binding protein [Deltaproteobacteria bacterium]|nr:extracellular solute-binding protein [Deltaproteobacteria bacterium]